MLRWFFLAGVTGILVGMVSVAFSYCDVKANAVRGEYPLIILGLPAAGLLIVFLYHAAGVKETLGTNRIFTTLQAKTDLPVRMAPLIFVSTILTHLFGGSVGREGAALQLGGALGALLGLIPALDLEDDDRRVIIMCGMSAAFSAIFGTPAAAAFFPIEVVSVGHLKYSALFPCLIASLAASQFARNLGFDKENLGSVFTTNALRPDTLFKVMVLAVCCALLSILFCLMLRWSETFFHRMHSSGYVRIAVGGCIFLVLTGVTYAMGTPNYLGAGMDVIERAVHGEGIWYDFLLKMLLTSVCIGAGYKGGEIVPSFFIGASFGCLFSRLTGLPPSLGAACGMAAMFCGVTNSPVSSFLIISELFGFREGALYFLLSIAVSYVMSGYFGLYDSQQFMFSKFRTRSILRTSGAYDRSLETDREEDG